MMKRINLLSIILAFFAGLGAGYALIKSKLKPALKEIINDLVDDMTEDIYPCRLIATIRFNQPNDQCIVDMSKYESQGLIGIVVDKIEAPANKEEEKIDGEPALYPTAVVYKLGEHWLWKVL